jgi:hypothetical protein
VLISLSETLADQHMCASLGLMMYRCSVAGNTFCRVLELIPWFVVSLLFLSSRFFHFLPRNVH